MTFQYAYKINSALHYMEENPGNFGGIGSAHSSVLKHLEENGLSFQKAPKIKVGKQRIIDL